MDELDLLRKELDSLRNQLEKSRPQIRGFFSIESRDDSGRVLQKFEGENILTLTGREFYSELAVLKAFTPVQANRVFRDDRLAYFGLGTGAQAEVPNITKLVAPTAYVSGQFLAPVQMPATFPAGVTSRTSVRLVREYSRAEISLLGATVVVTEAGIFSDGNPAANWDTTARPTSMVAASEDAPFFYKTFEPIVCTPESTVRLSWELRVV